MCNLPTDTVLPKKVGLGSSLWNLAAKIVSAGSTFVFTILAIRIFGISGYGRYVFVQSFLQMAMLILSSLSSGFSNLIVSHGYVSKGLAKWGLISSSIYAAVVTAIYVRVFHTVRVEYIPMLAYAIGVYTSGVFQTLFNADASFKRSGLLQLLSSVGTFFGLFLAHFYQLTPISPLNVLLIAVGIFTILSSIAVTVDKDGRGYWVGRVDLRSYLLNSFKLTIAYAIVNTSDVFMISGTRLIYGYLAGVDGLALYDFAMKFILMGRLVVLNFFGLLGPYFSSLRVQGEEKVKKIFSAVSGFGTAASAVTFAVLVFVGPAVERLSVNERVNRSDWLLILVALALGNSIHSSTAVHSSFMFSRGRTTGVYAMEISAITAFGIVCAVTIHRLEFLSVPLSVGVAMSVSSIIYAWIVEHSIGINGLSGSLYLIVSNLGIMLYALITFQLGRVSYPVELVCALLTLISATIPFFRYGYLVNDLSKSYKLNGGN